MASFLNPFSDNFILSGVLGNLTDILDYINPFSDNFILKDIINGIGNILSYINPFSENFILKDVINFLGNIISYLNPFSDNFILKDLFTWIGDFFTNLKDFFINIFVPTEEQWADLDEQDKQFQEQIEGKFEFFYWFQDEIKKAEDYVYSDDFLNIKFPAWNMNLGIIKYQTNEINFTSVRDAYAPYRLTIRNSLFVIAVGLAIVYLIKYVLNYSVTSSDIKHISNEVGDKK